MDASCAIQESIHSQKFCDIVWLFNMSRILGTYQILSVLSYCISITLTASGIITESVTLPLQILVSELVKRLAQMT